MALDTGVTTWLLVSAALVMLMVPGVGLFYAGLVRRKNIISMIALSFVVLAVVSIFWMVIGYSLAFGPDVGGVIGNLDYAFLNGVSAFAGEKGYATDGIHGFPALFCGSDLNHHNIWSCRARTALFIYCVYDSLDNICVLPAGSLGMGRRMGTINGSSGFCRRHGR